ncbi:MAG: HAD-IA family hydrolase [Coriobacteriales bacterium]|jgi:putative hydrolase of the HAD superfamily|nr:HAD-IA family hydrolase [Coriobacteriales bacterium]
MRQTGITTVFFDVGNTLLTPAEPEGAVFARAAARSGVQLDAAQVNARIPEMYRYYEQLYEQDDSFWADDQRAVEIWHTMYEYLCALLDVPAAQRIVIAEGVYQHYLAPESWTTFPDVLPCLEALSAQGLRLGLISNWDSSLRPVIEGMGLGYLFCEIIASAEVLLHKPQPAIFELALRRTGTPASAAMHIGDHASADVQGARAAGITPVYLNRRGERLKDAISIASLAELPALIAAH